MPGKRVLVPRTRRLEMKASQRHGVAPGAPRRRAAVHAAPRPTAAQRSGSRHVDGEGRVATERNTHRQQAVRELWRVIPVAPSKRANRHLRK